MCFEPNKLITLSHLYIVKFIGVSTNSHSFVVKRAPLKNLEHFRQKYAHEKEPFLSNKHLKIIFNAGRYNVFVCEIWLSVGKC